MPNTHCYCLILTVLSLTTQVVNGFALPGPSTLSGGSLLPRTISAKSPSLAAREAFMIPVGMEDSIDSFSTLVVAETSWRQYASLALISCVLLDIVLGSPFANMVMKPMRDAQEALQEAQGAQDEEGRKRERVNTELVAQEAIDKAQNALELRRYLDEQKSDWDRMEEMKKKLDADMDDLDADLEAREASLAKRRDKD